MFIMMNAARFSVGVQGIALADRAYQSALEYAKERIQGRDLKPGSRAPEPIFKHPDVRRMLMWQKATIEAMRGAGLRHRGVARLRAAPPRRDACARSTRRSSS